MADRVELNELQPSYNVAPSQTEPVVGENEDGRRSILPFQWGFLPFWADEKDTSYSMINAQVEYNKPKKNGILYQRLFKLSSMYTLHMPDKLKRPRFPEP
ncbi:SOS response-associated peptidase family protein [Rhodohalobacter sp. 8-1]|uniref:SOS response-associated peptidase family protein n=1 Tax=Rhodohalobacter sp. 8-1 TaxID=3131972 RepID=UPI0030EC2692